MAANLGDPAEQLTTNPNEAINRVIKEAQNNDLLSLIKCLELMKKRIFDYQFNQMVEVTKYSYYELCLYNVLW